MIAFLAAFLRLFFRALGSKRNVLVVLNGAADIKHQLTLVKPETILSWQRTLLKRFWTFEHRPAPRCRKPVDTEVKDLILSMKNDTLLWAVDAPNMNSIMERLFRTVRKQVGCLPERCPGWVASSLLQTSGLMDGISPP
jgi:hypothetical protein